MKPILFNTDMVRAILEGRKTVTRRVVKPQPKGRIAYACMGHKHGTWGYPGKDAWKYWGKEYRRPETLTEEEADMRWTPPCRVDDILYVRETWQYAYELDGNEQIIEGTGRFFYAADGPGPFNDWVMPDGTHRDSMPWRPSIHMPKEAARLFLRVKDVRVERLQEITLEEVEKEGIDPKSAMFSEYVDLWNTTVKPTDRNRYGWGANPWVWVIEFERISKEEAHNE